MGEVEPDYNVPAHIKQPQDIAEFRKLLSPSELYVIPEVPEKRKRTDVKFTIFFGMCIALLFPFLIYTFTQSDLNRFFRGVDPCGNICGKDNPKYDEIVCSGQDKTGLPLLKYYTQTQGTPDQLDYVVNQNVSNVNFTCVESCDTSEYTIFLNRCFPASIEEQEVSAQFEKWASDINKSAGYIVALCFIGLGLCIGILFLFRYCTAAAIWSILVGSSIVIITITVHFWVINKNHPSKKIKTLAITFTVISVILVFVLLCTIKKIKLVIRLFKEATKVVFAMPLILCEPLLTILAGAILLIVFAFFMLIFTTAGALQKVNFELYEYVPNGVILFTVCLHCVICLWMLQFIIGCQHMVISGAVAAYYFARDKSTLTSPIYRSFYNLVKYHLGTVAFGSLIITIITIIKALLRALAENKQTKIFVDCCIGCIEGILQYLTKNAYIMTAMHGQPFWKSGKRAVRLLSSNLLSSVAVNNIGSFVLIMTEILIVMCVVGIGTRLGKLSDVDNFWPAILISAIVTAIIADCFFSVFDITIDTLFLCFCEDNSLNDGIDRPYYMTTDFMQYVEDAKKQVKAPKKSKE